MQKFQVQKESSFTSIHEKSQSKIYWKKCVLRKVYYTKITFKNYGSV